MVPPAFTAAAASKRCNGRTRLLYDSCLSLQERRFPRRERRRGFASRPHRLPPNSDSLLKPLRLLISAHVKIRRSIFRPIIQSRIPKSRNRASRSRSPRDTIVDMRFHRVETLVDRIDILANYIYPLEVIKCTFGHRQVYRPWDSHKRIP